MISIGLKGFAAVPSINEVRSLYKQAASEERSGEKLIRLLALYNEKNNTLFSGYKAATTMIMAKHALNPFVKLGQFNKGRKMLERAIRADDKNVELRFLRFTTQTNAPAFLGYNNNIPSDKEFLLKYSSELTDIPLKNTIDSYLKNFVKPLT
jgi:hypothetical protein